MDAVKRVRPLSIPDHFSHPLTALWCRTPPRSRAGTLHSARSQGKYVHATSCYSQSPRMPAGIRRDSLPDKGLLLPTMHHINTNQLWLSCRVFSYVFNPPPKTCLGGGSPLPPHLRSRRNQGSFFLLANFFSPTPSVHRWQGSLVIPPVSLLPCVSDIMLQCPISTFFGTPVQPCPGTKRNNVMTAILYFHFQDRWSGKTMQAYNAAQKARSTLFLNTPMATLCEFVRQEAIMARQDCKVRCLPHEVLLMQPVVRARWAVLL